MANRQAHISSRGNNRVPAYCRGGIIAEILCLITSLKKSVFAKVLANN